MVRGIIRCIIRCIFCAAFVVLAGCQTVPVDGDFCRRNQPLRFSSAQVDAMTDEQVARVLAHNERGAKLCGWKR